MSTTNANKATEQSITIEAAAVAHAARLCEMAFKACSEHSASPAQVARAKRYQLEEFRIGGRACKRIERIVLDLVGVESFTTRAELLVAIELYADAGIAEVTRRFAAAASSML